MGGSGRQAETSARQQAELAAAETAEEIEQLRWNSRAATEEVWSIEKHDLLRPIFFTKTP
jgi:hypothetical protein